jgi:hypothetical protein
MKILNRAHKLVLLILAAFVLVGALSYLNLKAVGVTQGQMTEFIKLEAVWLGKFYIYALALCCVWIVGKRLFPSKNERRYTIEGVRRQHAPFLPVDQGEFKAAPGSVLDYRKF